MRIVLFGNDILFYVTAFDFPIACSFKYNFCLESVVILERFGFSLMYVLYI